MEGGGEYSLCWPFWVRAQSGPLVLGAAAPRNSYIITQTLPMAKIGTERNLILHSKTWGFYRAASAKRFDPPLINRERKQSHIMRGVIWVIASYSSKGCVWDEPTLEKVAKHPHVEYELLEGGTHVPSSLLTPATPRCHLSECNTSWVDCESHGPIYAETTSQESHFVHCFLSIYNRTVILFDLLSFHDHPHSNAHCFSPHMSVLKIRMQAFYSTTVNLA